MHLISRDSLDFNRVLPNGFLNPQRFDGDVFETSTTTSQHDGTTCTDIHTMNKPTPIICLELTHQMNEPQSLINSAHSSIQLCFTRTQCDAWLNTTPRGNEIITHCKVPPEVDRRDSLHVTQSASVVKTTVSVSSGTGYHRM